MNKIKALLAAKAAWLAAITAKKAKTETDPLYAKVAEAQRAVDEALASGEIKQEEIDAAGKSIETPTKDDKQPDNVVLLDDIKSAINDVVAAQLKALLPESANTQLTPDMVTKAVKEALDARKDPAAGVKLDEVKDVATKAVSAALANIRVEGKALFSKEDGNQRGQVEIPCGWTKGNLPLHGKQLLNVIMSRPMNDGIDAKDIARGEKLANDTLNRYEGMAKRGEKALTSTTASSGDELVPTSLSAELQRRFYLSSDLAAYMASREIDMPTQPFEYPLITTRPSFYVETTENTAATATDPGTGKITLNAVKLMGKVVFSYEVEEDAIIPLLPTIQGLLAEAAADAYEDGIINGDSDGTHQDSDYQAIAKHAAKAFDGLRKMAWAVPALKVSFATGGITEANMRSVKKALNKYGVRVRDLVWIVGPKGINDVGGITNVSTLEKYGPRATILTGEIGSFLGIPILVSERCRENLNATGFYDGTTTTKGSLLLANMAHFVAGRRRGFSVEIDKDISSQSMFLVASYRRAFQAAETVSATITAVAGAYNYDS